MANLPGGEDYSRLQWVSARSDLEITIPTAGKRVQRLRISEDFYKLCQYYTIYTYCTATIV